MTTPVNVLSLTLDEVHEAARANTAWTAMYLQSSALAEERRDHEAYNPWTLKLSNMISAVFSLFSGGLRGGSVYSISRMTFCIRENDVQGEHNGPLVRPASI